MKLEREEILPDPHPSQAAEGEASYVLISPFTAWDLIVAWALQIVKVALKLEA